MSEKKIEVCTLKAEDLKTGFGNPRKIQKKKLDELANSIETFGDFGIFLIDEDNNVIGGNQRLKAIMNKFGPETQVTCKRLIGYTKAELKAINIKDNTHSGEWDLSALADWTADINFDLGLDTTLKKDVEERSIKEMEPIHYEKYDYVLIACKNELDYNDLTRRLGLADKVVPVTRKRSIKARAIWYDKMKAQIISADEVEAMENGND